MIMLYAVRMRLVFISSVTAMTPLRTISAITGSSGPRFVRSVPICFVVFRAIALLPAGAVYVARMERKRNPGSASPYLERLPGLRLRSIRATTHDRLFPTAMSRLPKRSTSKASPGISTVVDACSSISAGPLIRLPAVSRSRAKVRVSMKP